jgi:gluconolactonase
MLTRRRFVEALGAAGAAAGLSGLAAAQTPQAPPGPPSTVTTPPRDFGPNAPPTTYFTDPDIVTVDPLFNSTS